MQCIQYYGALVVLGITLLSSCTGSRNECETNNGWVTFECREGISYSDAWQIAVDALLTRGFKFQDLSKDDGSIKTEPYYASDSLRMTETLTTVFVEFTDGRRTIRIKACIDCISGSSQDCEKNARVSDLMVELRARLV